MHPVRYYGTGISIFLIDALQTLGIGLDSSEIGGDAAWNEKENKGNRIILGLSFMDRIPIEIETGEWWE